MAIAPHTGGENLNFFASNPAMPANKAFPKGMKIFPIRKVAITKLNRPVRAPSIGPTATATNKEGRADKWNSTVVPGADGNLIPKKPRTFPRALMVTINARVLAEYFMMPF